MAKKKRVKTLSFEEAIKMGEYAPKYLATYPEWHQFSKHVQFQYIKKAIDNKRKQLLVQWAEVNNMLDFSKKSHLAETLKNIEEQLDIVERDRELIFVEYSKS
jgi:hypothetical protein